jgi:WD40 repeat protein
VKLWDIRSGPTAVATMGVQANDFASTTHAEMVTCVDVSADGGMVLSGSLDQSLAAWDMRSLGTRPLATAGPTSVSSTC